AAPHGTLHSRWLKNVIGECRLPIADRRVVDCRSSIDGLPIADFIANRRFDARFNLNSSIRRSSLDNRQSVDRQSPIANRHYGVALFAEQLRILLLLNLVDLVHVLIGGLLDFVEALALVVFGNLVVLEELLQLLVRVAADLAHAVAPVLGVLVHELRQLLAAL